VHYFYRNHFSIHNRSALDFTTVVKSIVIVAKLLYYVLYNVLISYCTGIIDSSLAGAYTICINALIIPSCIPVRVDFVSCLVICYEVSTSK